MILILTNEEKDLIINALRTKEALHHSNAYGRKAAAYAQNDCTCEDFVLKAYNESKGN